MRSLLGRFHRPFARGVDEQLLLLNNLGDGSTLSLDFTTGVLDPRLTFSRTSNATFINSSGYVEWANANMYWNTAFEGLSGSNPSLTSSGWGYALSTGGAAVFNGDGSVTVTTTAAERRAIFRSSGFSGGGLRVVASVDVTIHSGSLQASQVIVTGTPSNAQHYVDGVIWNSSHPNWNGGILPVGTQFNISYATDSQTSGTTSMYFGVGCSSTIAGSATFSNPRWTMWKGSGTVPYYPNTSVTNNVPVNTFKSGDYQAPRFDYDPTSIGTPRGLLIEGTANQLLTYSEDYSQAVWTKVTVDRTTGQNSPDGGTGATLISENATTYAKHDLERSQTITAGIHTFSVWVKEPSTNSRRYVCLQLADGQATAARYTIVADLQTGTITATGSTNGTAGAPTGTGHSITPYRDGWYRLTITMNHVASPCYPVVLLSDVSTLFGGNNQPFYSASSPYKGLIVWGAQLETGSGASSYIPTGASTGTRNRDQLSLTNLASIAFSQTSGTAFAQVQVREKTDSTFLPYGSFNTSGGGRCWWWLRHNLSTTSGTRLLGNAFNSGGATVLSTANYVYNSGNGGVVKFATSLDTAASSMVYVISGGAPQTTTAAAFTLATAAEWGLNTSSDVGATDLGSMWVKSFKYWPTALPNAQLQSLTT